uniref:Extracellular metalloproteinase, serralysin family n=2 Tax=Aeromonas sp. Ne-1 TaxID=1675689 RepID=A0A0H4J9N8_9GAMM|nr:extracellular metalloproteinase, serralysin family [Aeromonas sp. Ne-1]
MIALISYLSIGFNPFHSNAEEKTIPLAECKMTIQKEKHTKNDPVHGSGICKDLIDGFYSPTANVYRVTGMVEREITESGQQLIIGVPYHGYSEAKLTVYLEKDESVKEKDTTKNKESNTPSKILGVLGVFIIVAIVYFFKRKKGVNDKL